MTFPPAKVLLASDGSTDAALAAKAAVDIARKTGAEIHVVHVWRSIPSTRFESYIRARLEEEARETLDRQVEQVRGDEAIIVESHLKEGSAAEEILDLAEEIGTDLVLIGSRGLGPVKRLALGSVSEAVAHHATRPVLVLRGGWPPTRVVVGDDGSDAAESAGKLAAFIGGLFGTKALLVRTYPELPEIDVEGRRLNPRLVDDELKREWRKLDERAMRTGNAGGIRPTVRLSAGEPAASLLEAAEEEGAPETTLIAVGSRGLEPMQRMRLGSVSTKVLRAARGPVLVYPHLTGIQERRDPE